MTLDDSKFIDPATVSPRNVGVRWGLIWGGASIAIALITHLLGWDLPTDDNKMMGYLMAIIGFSVAGYCVVKAAQQHRDEELGGYISLGRCVTVGFWAGLVSGLMTGIWQLLLHKVIDPNFSAQMRAAMMEQFTKQGMDEEKAEQMLSFMSWNIDPSPLMAIGGGLVAGAIFGVIIGLIVGFFQKRERPMA